MEKAKDKIIFTHTLVCTATSVLCLTYTMRLLQFSAQWKVFYLNFDERIVSSILRRLSSFLRMDVNTSRPSTICSDYLARLKSLWKAVNVTFSR